MIINKFLTSCYKGLNHFLLIMLLLVSMLCCGCQPRRYGQAPTNGLSSLIKPLIIIDAGHGGQDFGASNAKMKLYEKQLCLKTAQLVKKKLEAKGYSLKMLRSKDEYISLSKRVHTANQCSNSILISIHFNSAPNKLAHGIEVFYFQNHSLDTSSMQREKHSEKLASCLLASTLQTTLAASRGLKKASFRMIKDTSMPACLIEGGFMTNAKEAKKLSKAQYLNDLAEGITLGIEKYLKSSL